MTPRQIISISFLSAVLAIGLILGGAKLATAHPPGAASFVGLSHHGGWHHRGGQGLGHLCGKRGAERIEDTITFVEAFMDFTPPQLESWNKLTSALRAGSTSISETCNDLKQADRPDTAPERLARLETMMASGLKVVQQIRPAFDAFYATLTDQQKQALDDLISRGHLR